MIKWIAIILTGLGMLVGGIFFVEDRYFHEEAAKELEQRVEKGAVKTFESFQKSLDIRHLEDLRDKKAIIERELNRNPNDTYLKMRQEEIDREKQRLEMETK